LAEQTVHLVAESQFKQLVPQAVQTPMAPDTYQEVEVSTKVLEGQ